MSRHGRRGKDEEQDGGWRPGDYGPPAADGDPPGGGYRRPGRRHRDDPLSEDYGTGGLAPPGQAAEPYAWTPDSGTGSPDPFRWTPDHAGAAPDPYALSPDPLGGPAADPYALSADPLGGAAPDPYALAADPLGGRSAGGPAPYPGHDPYQVQSGRAVPPDGAAPRTSRAPWEEEEEAFGRPSGPLPGLPSAVPPERYPDGHPQGHPSGPLPPLPPSDLAWRESLAGPQPAEPGIDPFRPDGPSRPSRRAAWQHGVGRGDRPAEGPAGYQADPLQDSMANGSYAVDPYADVVAGGYSGYESYVDDPSGKRLRDDDGADRYADTGAWYAEEPQAWGPDRDDEDLLPGLTSERGARGRGTGGPGTKTRKRRRRGRMVLLVLGIVFLLVVVSGGAVGYHYYRTYFRPPDFSGPGTGTQVVQIKPGDSATAVGERLAGLGVVASARAFSIAAKNSTDGRALEPGYYRLHKHMQASLAFALLLRPSSRVQLKVVIPEGWRLARIIQTLGKDTGNLKGYEQAAADPAALGLPSFANGKPEGYLFPATYDVQPKTPPSKVLAGMVTAFDREAASVDLPVAAAHGELTQGEAITVASLIQAEGKRPQDFPKIAEVIYRRLDSNMPLQLDTTVLYAMHSTANDVTIAQTHFKSPYNTYLHTGLPPGPIDSPGDTAIRAALHPAHGTFLYFLTVNPKTGLTKFTSSFTVFQQFMAELKANGG